MKFIIYQFEKVTLTKRKESIMNSHATLSYEMLSALYISKKVFKYYAYCCKITIEN